MIEMRTPGLNIVIFFFFFKLHNVSNLKLTQFTGNDVQKIKKVLIRTRASSLGHVQGLTD